VAAGQLGLIGGAQPIFVFFPKCTKNKYTTTFGSPIAKKICSNYSIRRWSFLFIYFEIINLYKLDIKCHFDGKEKYEKYIISCQEKLFTWKNKHYISIQEKIFNRFQNPSIYIIKGLTFCFCSLSLQNVSHVEDYLVDLSFIE
jgi:hypothetical protein